jgi:hypothetical protein
MIDKFENLLQFLSTKLDAPLKLDSNQSCYILFDDSLGIQIELDDTLENLIIFSSITEIPPGKFRENVLLNSLKENNKYPFLVTFGYLEKTNSLAIFNFLKLSSLDNEQLLSYLQTFVELGFLYKDAISKGNLSTLFG